MTVSYNWLQEYIPDTIEIEKLSRILTSVGLEVESVTPYQEHKGNLQGIVVGEILTCTAHPDADKLKITTVNIGATEPLQIVCGAPNVAVGQKVMVATIGTTIYPTNGEPLTMKKAKIRGVESFGMICAEDEIGTGTSHDGILILPPQTAIGTLANQYYESYTDSIIEIGLTPNHMDAQSHLGVARDVIAYMNHHEKKNWNLKIPYPKAFKPDTDTEKITVTIENEEACTRYAGIVISNITVAESPKWLQQKIKAIGLRPINNVVDSTNYILHETGQPLHAFDFERIVGNKIIVKNAEDKSTFTTLDEKERTLAANDLMICNATEPMCIAGVFGGLHSGVTNSTTSIFLESAIFNGTAIRKTSLHHNLRTDAAVRFEKGVDSSNVVNVLKRAALLIKEIAGGTISSDIIDVYANPIPKKIVAIKYHYLKKLSGKNYHPETIKNILQHLGFEVDKDGIDELAVLVPYHKTDINIPADLVEEIMRIDGLDNVEIPKTISIAPSVNENNYAEKLKEKIAQSLVGLGLQEIFTNSITNSAFVTEAYKHTVVKMLNNLSTELDVLRTTMLETGLQAIAYNINRKNTNLQLFEFGRTYATDTNNNYTETEHLAIYLTGNKYEQQWKHKATATDFYTAKAIAQNVLNSAGLTYTTKAVDNENTLHYIVQNKLVAIVTEVATNDLTLFAIKQPVYHIDIYWSVITNIGKQATITYTELSKYPSVQRDIAVVVDKNITYQQIAAAVQKANIKKLQSTNLFDIFESDKLGTNKKSMAINVTFVDNEKTLTDTEIESFVKKIRTNLEKETGAEERN